ncbi:MAG TPA: S8 family serine peptidase, partial [Albitalea sp.]|nr:S8 family serine peptidase [Albitalea sp.]
MRHRLPTLAALCALILPAALHAPLAQALTQRDTVGSREPTARVIVRYKPGATAMRALSAPITAVRGPQQAAALSQRLGLLLSDGHAIGDQAQVVFAKGISSAALAARLAADADVEFAEPDQRRRARAIPNDPLYGGSQPSVTPTVGQWYLRPPTSTNVSAIDAETAWLTTTGTSSVTVAVLDTGVRFDHPDLAGKLHPGYDFVSDVKTANDGTGRDSDPSDPGDWVTQAEVDNDPDFSSCGDAVGGSSWHGTQVAGLIGAATNNAFGMASVGRHVMVLPVRVLGKCGGFDSDIQQAMLWSAGVSSNPFANPHPAKVLNLSFGSPGSCPTSYQTVINTLTAAGVSVVVSAGNDPGLAVNAPANCSGA